MSKIKILNATYTELLQLNAVISANRTEKINGENTLAFTTVLGSPIYTAINDTNVVGLDEDLFDIAAYRKEQQSDGSFLASVECEHISYRLNDSEYDVEYFTEQGVPA